MKLKELKLTDVLSHVDSRIELGETLTVLTGGSDSGKSAVMRGLLQLCRNEPAGIDLLRHAAKRGACSEVALTGVTDDGAPFQVTRRRGKSKNEYEVDGKPLLAFGQEVPVEVRSLLRLSPHAFQIQSDGSFMLSATDGAVAKILSSTVGLAEIDAAFTDIRIRKTANDTALRCAESDLLRETEAEAAYSGLEASDAAVADFEAACLRLSDAADVVDAASLSAALLERTPAAANSLCEDALDSLKQAMVAAVPITCAAAEILIADKLTADYAAIPANGSRQRITAISAVNAAEVAREAREEANDVLRDMSPYLAAAAALKPDVGGRCSEAAALFGNAVVAANALARDVAAYDAVIAVLAAAPILGDAGADAKAALRLLNYAGADASALTVAEGGLAEVLAYLKSCEEVELGCCDSLRQFKTATIEVENYKTTHPVCPECGAEQRYWRKS